MRNEEEYIHVSRQNMRGVKGQVSFAAKKTHVNEESGVEVLRTINCVNGRVGRAMSGLEQWKVQ